jgi:predicted  nucleic acid-binding Zn-ribbon protein
MMTTTSKQWTAQVLGHKRRLDEYKQTVSRLFPALPRDLVDARSIRDVDALVLALFLRCYPHELSVLEVGTFFGVSTFHLASQPSVSRVLGVDPDLPDGGRAGETSRTLDSEGEPLQGLRVIDIARAALAEFADESAKVELRSGDVGSAWTNHSGATPEGSEKMPAQELSDDQPLLAFVNGASTREAVDADLQAIFDANPRAIAVLDHCRGLGGHFVQAGIAGFMERDQDEYRFRLFGDLSSGMATSNLGIVYPAVSSAEIQECLRELGQLFSERLDPLWLASREQELIGIVNTYKDEAASLGGQLQDSIGEHQLLAGHNKDLEKRISRLEKRKSQLEERNAGLKEEKKGFQKRNSQLEKRATQLEKRKSQLEENNSRLKEEKKGLQSRVSQLEKGSSRLEERIARLQERNTRLKEERLLLDSQLGDFRTAGRYKLADAVTKNVLRIPGAKALARRTRPEE